MAEASAKCKHVSLSNEETDGVVDEDTDMEVPVDGSDYDWGDNDEGESDRESENEPKLQHESDHEDNVQHVANGFIPNGNVHPKFAFVGTNGVKVDIENETNVLKYFFSYMDDSMWQLTVKQANLYVTQFSVAHPNLKP
jgi:hypothetical protein